MKQEQLNNLIFARAALAHVSSQRIVSCDDIIPWRLLPHIMEDEIPQYVKMFGLKKFDTYCLVNEAINALRLLCFTEMKRLGTTKDSSEIMGHLTTSKFRFGSCGEQSSASLVYLLDLNLEIEARIVVGHDSADSSMPLHGFVLIGKDVNLVAAHNAFNINKWTEVPEDWIILDPFLRLIFPAKDFLKNKSMQEYLTKFKIDSFYLEEPITAKILSEIQAKSESIYQNILHLLQFWQKHPKSKKGSISSELVSFILTFGDLNRINPNQFFAQPVPIVAPNTPQAYNSAPSVH